MTADELNAWLAATREVKRVFAGESLLRLRDRICCVDGFSLSVQASAYHCCSPRKNDGPYSALEVGFPSVVDERLLPFADDPEDPRGSVYDYVPIEVVAAVITAHGGIVNDTTTSRRTA